MGGGGGGGGGGGLERNFGGHTHFWLHTSKKNVIWLGAKYRKNSLITKQDPRVRIEVGKLMEVIASNRTVLECRIYGSTPPTHDSFWKICHQFGIKVVIYQRSKVTNEEKQVDTSLCGDITACALESKYSPFKISFSIVSGDLDFAPPAR